ncbi:hypothetical protein LguiA_008436 [Lonicera macranthoides]
MYEIFVRLKLYTWGFIKKLLMPSLLKLKNTSQQPGKKKFHGVSQYMAIILFGETLGNEMMELSIAKVKGKGNDKSGRPGQKVKKKGANLQKHASAYKIVAYSINIFIILFTYYNTNVLL